MFYREGTHSRYMGEGNFIVFIKDPAVTATRITCCRSREQKWTAKGTASMRIEEVQLTLPFVQLG
jgi:hypothetical protein